MTTFLKVRPSTKTLFVEQFWITVWSKYEFYNQKCDEEKVFSYIDELHVGFGLERLQCLELELLIELLGHGAVLEVDDVLPRSDIDVPKVLPIRPCVSKIAIQFFYEVLWGVVYFDEHSAQKQVRKE